MNNRLVKIDEIRGATLISMLLYHFMWDLKYIAGFQMDWYTSLFGRIWQQSICISFIFISGFCFHLGKKHLKRSGFTFLCGIVITLVTILVMPENRVVFGILTFIGSAGFIMIILDKLIKKLDNVLNPFNLNMTVFVGSLLLFIVFYSVNFGTINLLFKKAELPAYLYSGYFETYLGFTDPSFYSTDYFSIIPWMFIYMCGYSFFDIILHKNAELSYNESRIYRWLTSGNSKPLAYIGNKTLLIYMLHQPVLYLLTLVIMKFKA